MKVPVAHLTLEIDVGLKLVQARGPVHSLAVGADSPDDLAGAVSNYSRTECLIAVRKPVVSYSNAVVNSFPSIASCRAARRPVV